MSTRFYPRSDADPSSRGARISAAIYEPTAALLKVSASTPAPRGDDASSVSRTIAALLEPAVRGSSSRLRAHQLSKALGEPVASTAPAPAPAVKVAAAPAPAPKPMPVPADVEAKGPEFVRGYRDGFRKETARCLALLANPATCGRHIAVGQLIGQGLTDAQILARLPQEATDDQQRAKMRQAEIGAVWDRAYARAFGQPVPPPYTSAEVGDVWSKAIAANNPGHQPSAAPSNSGDAWDRVYAKMHRK
jgi:hypothetical protein